MSENGLRFGKPRTASRWPSEAGREEREAHGSCWLSQGPSYRVMPSVISLWEAWGPHERALGAQPFLRAEVRAALFSYS